jgi:hypothetical protein
MIGNRNEVALAIIEKALKAIYDNHVTTTHILLMCQELVQLLDIEKDNEWIEYELTGYPPLPQGEKYEGYIFPPISRYIKLMGTVPKPSGIFPQPTVQQTAELIAHNNPTPLFFPVLESCDYLETTKDDMQLSKSIDISFEAYTVPITYYSKLSINRMRSIAKSTRARAHRFLSSHGISIRFGPLVKHIFDESMKIVNTKVADLDSRLLKELTDILQKQQEDTTDFDWRSTADACRNILQKFTEILLIDEMIPPGDNRPKEDQTREKVSLIIKWAKSILPGNHGEKDINLIEKAFDYFYYYFKSLTTIIEKVKHKPMTEVTKDEVDRVVAYLFLWMADLIRLLERVGYDWNKAVNH